MNSKPSLREAQLLERWLHLYLHYFNSPAKLKTLLEESGQDDPAGAIESAFAAVPHARIAEQSRSVELALTWAQAAPNFLVPLYSSQYPPLLFELNDPPAILFVRGCPDVLHLPQLAIVGSRHPSPDGRSLARHFAEQFCRAGFLVTSGLAYGIDAESHQQALQIQGSTIAVLGSGIDCIYPQKHRAMAGAITTSGALVSEFLPGAHANDWHFPRRNRIISGLSHGVLVVEAAQRSGSLITARLAVDQGREVFAVPGSIRNPQTRGCHWLLKKGAKLVEDMDDILEELPALLAWVNTRAGIAELLEEPQITAKRTALLSAAETEVLNEIGFDPVSLEQLVRVINIPAHDLLGRLAALELGGLVVGESGAYRRLGNDCNS